MNHVVLEEALRRIHSLPSLPTVVLELLASLNQEDVDIDVLAQKIAQDQALTAKTLRLANSSFYGMTRQVTTIAEAIAILGFRTVRSIATTAALIGTFAGSGHPGFDFAPFWRHAIAAAVCARALAAHVQVDPDYAYTAGLLHDIGRLVLVTQFPSQYEATMSYRVAHDCHLLQAEQTVLGLDHAVIGQALTQHWQFPPAMQQAVSEHHAPSSAGVAPLSLLVMAANVIAHALDLSGDTNDLVPAVADGLWQQLGLSDDDLLRVFAQTEDQFDGLSQVIGG